MPTSLVIDTRSHRVFVDGVAIELTQLEFALLLALARADGAVRSPEELSRAAWEGWTVHHHVIEVHVSRLRQRLGEPVHGGLIRTVRGAGYSLEGDARILGA